MQPTEILSRDSLPGQLLPSRTVTFTFTSLQMAMQYNHEKKERKKDIDISIYLRNGPKRNFGFVPIFENGTLRNDNAVSPKHMNNHMIHIYMVFRTLFRLEHRVDHQRKLHNVRNFSAPLRKNETFSKDFKRRYLSYHIFRFPLRSVLNR